MTEITFYLAFAISTNNYFEAHEKIVALLFMQYLNVAISHFAIILLLLKKGCMSQCFSHFCDVILTLRLSWNIVLPTFSKLPVAS
jgi:hypothetical protein